MPVVQSRANPAFKLLVSSVSGFIFGVALEKGRVFEPIIIRQQMLMSNFTMLKMFLSAAATGMLSFSLLTMIPATCQKMETAVSEFFKSLGTKQVTSAALGGLILGCGMTLSGACPGMVWIQVGAAVPNAVFTLLGAATGTFLYALTENCLSCLLNGDEVPEYHTLDEYLETPYFTLALPMASMLGTVVAGLDVFFPWRAEVEVFGEGILGVRAWPPYVAGAAIGLLQIPLVLFLQDTLGTGNGFMTLAAQVLTLSPMKKLSARLKKYKYGVTNWWQIFFLGGAMAGAYTSSAGSLTRGSVGGVNPWFGFSGGLLMLYGSRLAGGCTSGHGLSGMGLMSLLSFVAVPAMFASGIASAFFLKYGLGIEIDHL